MLIFYACMYSDMPWMFFIFINCLLSILDWAEHTVHLWAGQFHHGPPTYAQPQFKNCLALCCVRKQFSSHASLSSRNLSLVTKGATHYAFFLMWRFLIYSEEDAERIYHDAARLNLTGPSYGWFVTEQALRPHNVPQGELTFESLYNIVYSI